MNKTKLLTVGIYLIFAEAAGEIWQKELGEEFNCDAKNQACYSDQMCTTKFDDMYSKCWLIQEYWRIEECHLAGLVNAMASDNQ